MGATARDNSGAGVAVRRLVLTVLLMGLTLACAHPATRRGAHRASHPIRVGMTSGDVLESWGRPAEVLRLRTSDGSVTEEWRYPHGRLDASSVPSRVPVFIWLREDRVMAMFE